MTQKVTVTHQLFIYQTIGRRVFDCIILFDFEKCMKSILKAKVFAFVHVVILTDKNKKKLHQEV